MKKTRINKTRLSLIAVTLTVLATLLVTPTVVNANAGVSVIYGPEALTTGGYEETPVIALDSNGNAHIVWVHAPVFLMYKMVDPDGNVLIDETILNPCAQSTSKHVRRPSMVIDSDDMVHVVFHGFSLYTDFGVDEYGDRTDLDASEVIYVKFDPYLDDMDGDAADFFTITLVPETIISTDDGTKSRAPNMDIDPFDRLHVVWYDGPSGDELDVHYFVMDVDGNVLVAETTLTTGIYMDPGWGEPEIAVDSGGNAHIVYSTDTWDDDRELYYTMVNGDAGNTLIDDTRITLDDNNASVRAFLDVDSRGMVYVVWHDKRLFNLGTGEHELFFSMLDPSLDDQDGDSADPSVISVISEQRVTSDNDLKSFQKNLAIDSGDRVHVTWKEEEDFGEIYYSSGSPEGPSVPEMNVTNFGGSVAPANWFVSSGRNPDIAVTCDRVYITFSGDESDGGSNIYLVILSVPPCPAPPVGGEILPVDSLSLITPYVVVVTAVAATAIATMKKRVF